MKKLDNDMRIDKGVQIMKVFKEMTLKKFFIGTARNVGIGIGIGGLFWIEIVQNWRFNVYYMLPLNSPLLWFILDVLPFFAIAGLINIFIGKTIKSKILNTFIVGTIAYVTFFVILLIWVWVTGPIW